MKVMMQEIIIPKLCETFHPPVIHHTVIRTVGIGESFLAEKISAWEKSLPQHIRLAYLPGYGEVKLRLTAHGASAQILEKESKYFVEKIMSLAGEYIYAVGDDSLEAVIGDILRKRKLTLSAAESCTGGYLSHLITSIPGSSDYFLGSVVAYSNEIKINELGLKRETLDQHGAVSEATIKEMAVQVRRKYHTDIGVATSGIAGPGGGSPDKPVGTVWIAYADDQRTITRKLQLSKDRIINIKLSATAVLNLIRTSLAAKAET